MRFSVLIPVYNVEQYLRQCIDSIINQHYHDYEVIIVDDGSTDNSGKICDEYEQAYPNIVRVIHKQNQGLISARRVGIQQAKGDYCIFVDSDDYVSENLFSELSLFIDSHDVDMVIYSFTYFDGETLGKTHESIAENGYIWRGEDKKGLYQLLATTPAIDALWIKAIKTSILKDDPNDYSEYYSRNMSEDTLQSIYPLTAAQTVGYLDKSLYYYRYNPKSISRNFNSESIKNKNTNHVYYQIMNYLPVWGLDNKEMRNQVNARWFNEMMYSFCKSYESAKNTEDRKTILSFDWNSMLPCKDVDSYKEFVSPIHFQLYAWYVSQKYFKLNCFFLKQKIYKKYKTLKH